MEYTIKEVSTKKELISFIKFPMKLYRGNPYYVPPIVSFELSTLLPGKNPAFDHAEAAYWVVLKDKKIVGRIAAIVLETELAEKKLVRFGWIDFIDDKAVSSLLLNTAKNWAIEKGAASIHGPIGFTDLDFEGALIDGYDEVATQATIYNYPYYIEHYKDWGLETSATWVEIRTKVPDEVPRRIKRSAQLVTSRFGLKIKHINSLKEMLPYAPQAFDIMNEAYAHLYGYHPLTQKQIDYYVKLYFGFALKDFICGVENKEGEVVGFAITLPSLSKAFQKAKGRLYPFGVLHVLHAFFFNKKVDMFLIAVKPEYQKLGANALIFNELTSVYIKKGIKYTFTGPILEENRGMLNSWNDYLIDPVRIRRSCFIKQF